MHIRSSNTSWLFLHMHCLYSAPAQLLFLVARCCYTWSIILCVPCTAPNVGLQRLNQPNSGGQRAHFPRLCFVGSVYSCGSELGPATATVGPETHQAQVYAAQQPMRSQPRRVLECSIGILLRSHGISFSIQPCYAGLSKSSHLPAANRDCAVQGWAPGSARRLSRTALRIPY